MIVLTYAGKPIAVFDSMEALRKYLRRRGRYSGLSYRRIEVPFNPE